MALRPASQGPSQNFPLCAGELGWQNAEIFSKRGAWLHAVPSQSPALSLLLALVPSALEIAAQSGKGHAHGPGRSVR